MKYICVLLCLCLLLCAAGCAPREAQLDLFAMDTLIRLSAYGPGAEDALARVQTEIFRLETLFSRFDPDSDIGRLNAAAGERVSVEPETAVLLESALSLRERTGGLFEPTIAPVMDAWGFSDGNHRVPSPAELEDALAHVGSGLLLADAAAALEDPAAALDLGGIAKGYTGDLLLELLRGSGVTSAALTLGGNVALLGSRPDGSPWRVAVRDPLGGEYAAVIETADRHVVTSGGYERCFEANGVTYHHLIDPRTGAPADSGLLSVTVVAESGALADALSTALFVMGEEAAVRHWQEYRDFELMLITADRRVLTTEGLKYEPMNGAYVYGTI